jgi:GABA(A) receptor-associated protein
MQGLKYLFSKKPLPPTNKFNFKVQYSFDKRKEEAQRILEKHPNKIPIIVEKADNSEGVEIDKTKWLISEEITVGQLLLTIRRRIKLDASETVFLFVNNTYIPSNQETIGQLYNKHKEADLYLYITYSKEVAYGR